MNKGMLFLPRGEGAVVDLRLECRHMVMRNTLAVALMALLAPLIFVGSASAQAGLACSGTVCGLGGQIRGQIGEGLPLPLSIAPARSGPFSAVTIQTAPLFSAFSLPFVGNGLGQPGQIKPTPSATIMQTLGSAPRALTMRTAQFFYGDQPQRSFAAPGFAGVIFPVQTKLSFTFPHPGTTGHTAMNTVPGQGGSVMFSASGRPGGATVTFCAGSGGTGGSVDNNFNGAFSHPAMVSASTASCDSPGPAISLAGSATCEGSVRRWSSSTRTA